MIKEVISMVSLYEVTESGATLRQDLKKEDIVNVIKYIIGPRDDNKKPEIDYALDLVVSVSSRISDSVNKEKLNKVTKILRRVRREFVGVKTFLESVENV